ncbi:MAG: tRNA (guanosine(37)-N1)-methyltransferase TrmD [Clostridiales bacterium]|nr:tRNA (guanosine(37)-N1)-methyltransferase TrmD [Clostridiales bacterium]
MIFKILTIFPQMVEAVLNESILGRARKSGLIEAEVIDIRPFSASKHKNTDDTPYGGGAGMLMTPQPILDAMKYAMGDSFSGKRIYLSPRGSAFTQQKAQELAREDALILLCGHYEGVDQRVIDLAIDEEISLGDYVLTGGELGALAITDAVSRLVEGVLGCAESSRDESFSEGLLEYPQYTRPREFGGLTVPEVLLNGDQAEIDAWRRRRALELTLDRRPELLASARLSKQDRSLLREIRQTLPSVGVCFGGCGEELMLRILEEGEGRLIPVSPENAAARALFTQEEGSPAHCETVYTAFSSENGNALSLSPLAFDPAVTRVSGDEGISEAILFGGDIFDFACVAARLLPVKEVKGGVVKYGSSRRMKHVPSAKTRLLCRFKDGCTLDRHLNRYSNAFVKWLAGYLAAGGNAEAEKWAAEAKRLYEQLKRGTP